MWMNVTGISGSWTVKAATVQMQRVPEKRESYR